MAHSNLNAWAVLAAMAACGAFYGTRPHAALKQVIAIAERQQQKELMLYVKHRAKASAGGTTP